MKRAALLISILFHPLLMTTYMFTVFAVYMPGWFLPIRPSIMFIFLIFALTFVLPALNFTFFRLNGTIHDFNLINVRERRLPFVLIALLYTGVTLMFYLKFPVPNVLKLLLVINVLVVIATVITFFYKVSIHSLSMWAMVGIFLFLTKATNSSLFLFPLIITIMLAGLVMSSRLQLNAHTPREVMVGSSLGLFIGFSGMIIFF